jgi:cell division GTPase FtsZ
VGELKEAVGKGTDAMGGMENAWAAVAEASGEGREAAVIEAVCEDIMLEDGKAWREGNRVMVSVMTGADTSLSEFHGFLEKLKERLPVDLPISAGAAVDPDRTESLSVTLLVTRRVEESVLPQLSEITPSKIEEVVEEKNSEEPKVRKKRKYVASQTELEFEPTPSRFARSTPTVRGAEDLDRPTYQRRGIKLKV